jgi:hypothetical protein
MASHAFGTLELSADVVVQDVKVLDPTAGLARPENMPERLGGLRAQAPVGAGIRLAAETRYTGEQFALDPDTGAETRLPAAGKLNLELSRHWALSGAGGWFRGVQLRAAFDNVTDAAQFDAFGLPQPGRTMRAEVRFY